jgi:hypothetical protein
LFKFSNQNFGKKSKIKSQKIKVYPPGRIKLKSVRSEFCKNSPLRSWSRNLDLSDRGTEGEVENEISPTVARGRQEGV